MDASAKETGGEANPRPITSHTMSAGAAEAQAAAARRAWYAPLITHRYLYLMLLPGAVVLLIYRYLPMYGLTIAFKNFRLSRGIWRSPWIGFENFERFFSSPFFELIITNTVIISLLKLVFVFPVPIVLALMLNEVRVNWYKRGVQTVLYLPHFLSWVVIGHLAVVFLAPQTGVITNLLRDSIGLAPNMLMDPGAFRGTLVLTDIWKEAGWGTIIFLAALAGVDPDLYEAATIDGARKLQQIWYITLPSIMPVVIIIFILRIGHILDAGFEQIFILQNPVVYDVSEILDTYTYRAAFQEGQYSIGATVGFFKSVVGLGMVLAANWAIRKVGEEGVF